MFFIFLYGFYISLCFLYFFMFSIFLYGFYALIYIFVYLHEFHVSIWSYECFVYICKDTIILYLTGYFAYLYINRISTQGIPFHWILFSSYSLLSLGFPLAFLNLLGARILCCFLPLIHLSSPCVNKCYEQKTEYLCFFLRFPDFLPCIFEKMVYNILRVDINL